MSVFVSRRLKATFVVMAASVPALASAATLVSQPTAGPFKGGAYSSAGNPVYKDFGLADRSAIERITWWDNALNFRTVPSPTFHLRIFGVRHDPDDATEFPLLDPSRAFLDMVVDATITPVFVEEAARFGYPYGALRYDVILHRALTLEKGGYYLGIGSEAGGSSFMWARGTSARNGPLDRYCLTYMGSECTYQRSSDYPAPYDYQLSLESLAFEIEGASAAAVPEPAGWAMLALGFGLVGGTIRRRPRTAVAA